MDQMLTRNDKLSNVIGTICEQINNYCFFFITRDVKHTENSTIFSTEIKSVPLSEILPLNMSVRQT